MSRLGEKTMRADFKKLAKRFILIALCLLLAGGAASGIMLRTQIAESITQIQARDENHPGKESISVQGESVDRGHDKGWNYKDVSIFDSGQITEPSPGAKVVVGITGMLCCLLAFAYWLLIAAWLYQASTLSGMNGFFWAVLGLIGNLPAVLLFLVVRSLVRIRCPGCGYWQAKEPFCRHCGTTIYDKCRSCGAAVGIKDQYCGTCGKKLNREISENRAEHE